MILMRMQERTADEWMDVFRANGNVAAEPYLTTAEALHHPDIVAGGDIVTIDDPTLGPVRTIGAIAELTMTPAAIGRPAPLPGEHTAAVLASGGAERRRTGAPCRLAARRALRDGAPRSGRPLDGITVVEFATIIAAPLATTMLADLGARVIKVEALDGDPYRHLIAGGTTAAKTTAGKASICLDLKTDEGRRIARELAVGGRRGGAQHAAWCRRATRARRRRPAGREPRPGVGVAHRVRTPQPQRPPPGDPPVRRCGDRRRRLPGGPAVTAPCDGLPRCARSPGS